MFAIVKMGGKQYKVEEDQVIQVEKVKGDVGDPVAINEILLLSDGEDVLVGKDVPGSASVKAQITEQDRGPKLFPFKYKRRKGSRRKMGHRQYLTKLKITSIER